MGLWGRRRGRGRFHSGILVWGALTGDWALWRREVKRCPRRIAPLGVVRRGARGGWARRGVSALSAGPSSNYRIMGDVTVEGCLRCAKAPSTCYDRAGSRVSRRRIAPARVSAPARNRTRTRPSRSSCAFLRSALHAKSMPSTLQRIS